MNLFGRKKAPSVPIAPPVDAIKEIHAQLAVLEKRELLMNQRIRTCLETAVDRKKKGDTKAALFELKRKKLFETELEKLQGARITLDSQIIALEGSVINLETVKAVKVGVDAMKKIHANIDVDKVEDLMENIQEQKDIQDAIGEAISRPGRDMFDDEELLQELADLDALESSESLVNDTAFTLPNAPLKEPIVLLPSAPTSNIAVHVNETDEERQLRELEASMA